MKSIGKKIFTGIVALLVLAVPLAVAWGITNGMNSGNGLMTLTEARALVNQIYTAVTNPNGNSNQLSTAAAESYEHEYVDLGDHDGNAVFVLSLVKCALDDSNKNEDYIISELDFKSNDARNVNVSGTINLAYKLCENGVIIRMNWKYDSGYESVDRIELYRENNNNWKLVMAYIDPDYAKDNGNHEVGTLTLIGHDYKTMYYKSNRINYSGLLKKENVTLAFTEYADAENRVCEANAFGDVSGYDFIASTVGTLTDAQINDLIADSQNILNNYWYVNFAEKELRNSNFANEAYEIYYAYMNSVL